MVCEVEVDWVCYDDDGEGVYSGDDDFSEYDFDFIDSDSDDVEDDFYFGWVLFCCVLYGCRFVVMWYDDDDDEDEYEIDDDDEYEIDDGDDEESEYEMDDGWKIVICIKIFCVFVVLVCIGGCVWLLFDVLWFFESVRFRRARRRKNLDEGGKGVVWCWGVVWLVVWCVWSMKEMIVMLMCVMCGVVLMCVIECGVMCDGCCFWWNCC